MLPRLLGRSLSPSQAKEFGDVERARSLEATHRHITLTSGARNRPMPRRAARQRVRRASRPTPTLGQAVASQEMARRRQVPGEGGRDRGFLPFLLLAAALCAAAVQSSSAFSSAAPSRTRVQGVQHLPSAAPTATNRWVAVDFKPPRETSPFPWWSVTCALLTCAGACRLSRPAASSRAGRQARGCSVVACKAAAWQQPVARPRTATPPAPAAPAACAPKEEELLGWALSASPTMLTPPQTEALPAATIISLPAAPEAQPTAPVPRSRAAPAAFVGSARHRPGRSASRSSARRRPSRSSRAARRAVGARLLPSASPSVVEPSYDASRLRTEIQVGLHSEQLDRSKRPREVKTPSTGSGLNDQCGVFVETYLEKLPHQRDP
uniref:Uncharacterized protein n=1 Tax=Alexandrium monilatum TaxID=311494 RepID=A0A7S4SRQ3_9DINO